jgi:HSP20 family protein
MYNKEQREIAKRTGLLPGLHSELWSWDPFNELAALRDGMNDIFNSLFKGVTPSAYVWQPAMDIYQDDNHIVLETALPGMKKEDINIDVQKDSITVSGEMKRSKEVKQENYYSQERRYGKFSRTLAFPEEVDVNGVKAQFKDGVLKVTLPLKESEKTKKVKVVVE